jgi:hypothetical protein
LRSIPTFHMIGVSGSFTAGDLVLTSIAIIAGLWSGSVAVVVGAVVGYAIRPPIFLGLDFLPALVNVSIVALIFANRRNVARFNYALLLALFILSPYSLLFGYSFVPYTWFHLIAFLLILSPVMGKVHSWISRGGSFQVAAVACLALVGTMVQHLAGGLLYELVVGYVGGISPSSFKQFWGVIDRKSVV